MYACLCHAVTVEQVELAVLAGADTVEEIGEATLAGTGCGCCHSRLRGVIERVQLGMPALADHIRQPA